MTIMYKIWLLMEKSKLLCLWFKPWTTADGRRRRIHRGNGRPLVAQNLMDVITKKYRRIFQASWIFMPLVCLWVSYWRHWLVVDSLWTKLAICLPRPAGLANNLSVYPDVKNAPMWNSYLGWVIFKVVSCIPRRMFGLSHLKLEITCSRPQLNLLTNGSSEPFAI